jgi:hypothetical protein
MCQGEEGAQQAREKTNDEEMVGKPAQHNMMDNYDTTVRVKGRRKAMGRN